MKKQVLIIGFIMLSVLLLSGSDDKAAPAGDPLKIGDTMHGFTLEQKRFIKELDGEGYLFRHRQSGARLLKVASKDDNKVFSVAFKTPPPDDTGIPHIMEHSVLNGSENFPVKSPFDVLSQGSLNTFLNAMTSSDYTIYPVASRNDKDFANLMHVYLDAVFKPLLHRDPRILQQEGWHYEMESEEGSLTYKGVVYNEMKGAYSAPERQLELLVSRALFPDNHYGKSSGGHPDAIPQLTYGQFKAFHKKYYHPANSYIFLYGNGDLKKELAFIHDKYLSGYEKIAVDSAIPLQKPLAAPKVVRGHYGVPEGAAVEGKTYIARASVYGLNTDQELNIALDILAEALVNHQAAPLRLALQKAGIGQDVSAYADTVQQPIFALAVTHAEAKGRGALRAGLPRHPQGSDRQGLRSRHAGRDHQPPRVQSARGARIVHRHHGGDDGRWRLDVRRRPVRHPVVQQGTGRHPLQAGSEVFRGAGGKGPAGQSPRLHGNPGAQAGPGKGAGCRVGKQAGRDQGRDEPRGDCGGREADPGTDRLPAAPGRSRGAEDHPAAGDRRYREKGRGPAPEEGGTVRNAAVVLRCLHQGNRLPQPVFRRRRRRPGADPPTPSSTATCWG